MSENFFKTILNFYKKFISKLNPKLKKMKKLIFLLFISLISTSVFAQLRLDENFNYTVGDSLTAHGWVANTGGITNRLVVAATGLTYAGYPLSGIGGSTVVGSIGQDVYKVLSNNDSSGSVYCSFMVKVDSAKTGDYFLALLQTGSTSFYEGRVQVRSIDGTGNLSFGITKGNSSTDTTVANIWTPHSYTKGVTYLLVLKYTFIAGLANDAVSLFVFSSGLPAVEPAPTVGPISAYVSADATSIGRVAIRQGTTSKAPYLTLDGIRVANTWFSTVASVKMIVQGLYLASGVHSVADFAVLNVRAGTSPYAIIETSTATINPTTLVASFTLSNSLPSASYYLDTRYRILTSDRNAIDVYSAAPLPMGAYSGGAYDFTTSLAQAFMSNQVATFTKFGRYSGDVNQDGIIDGSDLNDVDNGVAAGASGYLNIDLTGDDFVDGGDLALVENNVAIGPVYITP